MLLVVLVYSLMVMPVRIRMGVCLCGTRGSFSVQADMPFFSLCFDGRITESSGAALPAFALRYGRGRTRFRSGRNRGRRRMLQRYLPAVLRSGCFEGGNVHLRMGLEDAGATAAAVGSAHAAIAVVLALIDHPCVVRVEPDYRMPCFCLSADCIFHISPGDIVFAVIKTAVKRRRKREPNGKTSH